MTSVCLVLAALFCIISKANGMDREYALKSGFIVNFVRYTEGLQHSSSPTIEMCSPDSGFLDTAKQTLGTISVQDKTVSTREVKSTQDLNNCHVVFITRRKNKEWLSHLSDYQAQGQLIIGETDAFLNTAGHIRFFISSGKIRFEIRPQRLSDSKLKLSSKVMRMALIAH